MHAISFHPLQLLSRLSTVLCEGLTRAQLEIIGKASDVVKTSRRDLPYVVATVCEPLHHLCHGND